MIRALTLINQLAQQFERDVLGFEAHAREIIGREGAAANLNRVREDLKHLRVQLSQQIAPFDGGPLSELVTRLADVAEQDAGGPIGANKAGPFYDTVSLEAGIAAERVRDALRSDELQALRSLRRAKLSALLDRRAAGPQFTRPDRGNRHWRSAVMVRTVVRELGVDTYNNAFLLALLSRGVNLAKFDGATFAIVGEVAGHSTLEQIERRLHPNVTTLFEAA